MQEAPVLSTTAGGNDSEPSPFWMIAHKARRVEIHGSASVRSISRPMWHALMIGIPSSCETYPGSTHLFGENESGRIAGTVVIA